MYRAHASRGVINLAHFATAGDLLHLRSFVGVYSRPYPVVPVSFSPTALIRDFGRC